MGFLYTDAIMKKIIIFILTIIALIIVWLFVSAQMKDRYSFGYEAGVEVGYEDGYEDAWSLYETEEKNQPSKTDINIGSMTVSEFGKARYNAGFLHGKQAAQSEALEKALGLNEDFIDSTTEYAFRAGIEYVCKTINHSSPACI